LASRAGRWELGGAGLPCSANGQLTASLGGPPGRLPQHARLHVTSQILGILLLLPLPQYHKKIKDENGALREELGRLRIEAHRTQVGSSWGVQWVGWCSHCSRCPTPIS